MRQHRLNGIGQATTNATFVCLTFALTVGVLSTYMAHRVTAKQASMPSQSAGAADSTGGSVQIGHPAPDFDLPTFPSGSIKLSDYRGRQNVILAFYPKDNSSMCTTEMCALSGDLSRFQSANTAVLAVSCDSLNSHQQFSGKYGLKQRLLSDSGGKVSRLYGAFSEDRSMSKRKLFVIDKKGIVQFIHDGMPDDSQLLEVIAKLQEAPSSSGRAAHKAN